MTKEVVVLGSDAEAILRVVREVGFVGVPWPGRGEDDADGTKQHREALRALEKASFIVVDLSDRPTNSQVAWAMGYVSARGKLPVAFVGDREEKLLALLEHSSYQVNTLDELRSVLVALDPNREPYVPGSMRSFD